MSACTRLKRRSRVAKLNADDHNSVEQKLVDAERSLSPEKSNIDIYQELDARRELE